MIELTVVTNPQSAATDFYRSVGPLWYIQKMTGGGVRLKTVTPPNIDWHQLFTSDVIFFSRPNGNTLLDIIAEVKDMGKRVWVDYDDLLDGLSDYNPAKEHFDREDVKESVKLILAMADAVSVSTQYLKDKYQDQTLLYIPKDMPPPNRPAFSLVLAERIFNILQLSQGRALVLFTSYHNLNLVYELLKDKLPYAIHRQGEAPRSILLEEFKQDIHSVLLATGSFWQGVDVPGEALSGLIIDKLPFDSPGDPMVAARIEAIRERGENPFMEYQIPSAIISLKQGLGRLIRKVSDRGILAILDSRVLTSRYGRFFIDSLPGMPLSHDLKDIDRFFENTDAFVSS